jgi:predicted transcriptional regulator
LADTIDRSELLALTTEIVSAQVGNSAVHDVPGLVQTVFDTLSALATGEAVPAELTPAISIKRSVTDDYIICLEDGKKLKMLKRHLMTAYSMTPQEYRARWNLRADYPMVAPNYARKRQELAKKIGLGRKPRVVEQAPEPTPAPEAAARKPRTKKAA